MLSVPWHDGTEVSPDTVGVVKFRFLFHFHAHLQVVKEWLPFLKGIFHTLVMVKGVFYHVEHRKKPSLELLETTGLGCSYYSGKHTKKLWNITMLFMAKSTISMAIFNSYVSLPQGISY